MTLTLKFDLNIKEAEAIKTNIKISCTQKFVLLEYVRFVWVCVAKLGLVILF